MKIVDQSLFERARTNLGKLGVAQLGVALVLGYFAFFHYGGVTDQSGMRLTLRIACGVLFYGGLKATLIRRAIDRSGQASDGG
jgi:hypothetical protein